MTSLGTDPLTLFSLSPKNDPAEGVFLHPENEHLISINAHGKPVIDIALPSLRGKSSTTLATPGRGKDADIYVEGSAIARTQCSFEIDLDTGIVMFYDRSHGSTSQVFGESATPFEVGRA